MPKVSPQLSPKTVLVFALAPMLALAGCGGGGNYPSLALRPAERAYTAQTPAPAPVTSTGPATPEPAIVRQVDALHADATRSSETFNQRAAEAEHLARAAHGAPVGSEAWSATTVAMAALDSARSDTAQSLAELDALQARMALVSAQSSSAADAATFQVVAQADSAVGTMLTDENAKIGALHALTGD